MTTKQYIYNLNLEKYDLLKKIDNNLLDYTIEEIFEIGYSSYVRNFIKKSFELNIGNEITNEMTNIKENKGSIGENIVKDILINKFPNFEIEDTSKKPHHGDFNLTFSSKKKCIIEVKNYNKTVDIEQVEKLKYDMKYSKINYSVFVSLNSGIVGKKKFEIESFFIDGILSFILFIPYASQKSIPNKKNIIIHNSFEESINNLSIKLEFSVNVIENISNSINEYKTFENNFHIKNINDLTDQLNLIYDEFKTIKKSSEKLQENIIKNLNSHLLTIKDFEFTINKKISSLITTKLKQNTIHNIKRGLKIKTNKINNKSWIVKYDNINVGRIILNNDYYYVNIKINEKKSFISKFNTFEQSTINIENYFQKFHNE